MAVSTTRGSPSERGEGGEPAPDGLIARFRAGQSGLIARHRSGRSARSSPGSGPATLNRRGWLVVLVSMAVLITAIGFTVWNRYLRQASPANPGTSCPTIVRPTGHLPLAAVGIHRVALIGDSIMNLASCSVAESLATVGIETGRYAVSGSGLLQGPVDWLKSTNFIMASYHPDAVIAVFVGNYWPPGPRDDHNRVIPNGSPEFFARWQQRAVQLSDEVRSAGAAMYWVSPPPIVSTILSHAQRLYDGYRTIPGDGTIDAGRILSGPGGRETLTKRTCGKTVVVRTPDLVHLTDDGARIYGEEIAHLFTAQTGVLTSPRPC